jgi:hypothetical protein
MGIYIILYLISRPKAMCSSDDIMNHKDCVWRLWHFHNKKRLVVGDISARVEKNRGKVTLALIPWRPWTATWRRKGLYSGRRWSRPAAAEAVRLPPMLWRQSGSSGGVLRELKSPAGVARRQSGSSARPLVHKILAMLWLEGSGEVGGNIQLCPLPT